MDHKDAICNLGEKVWEFRRQVGFERALPKNLQIEAVELFSAGVSGVALAKALGVTHKTISDWSKKYSKSEISESTAFAEVPVVNERPEFQAKLTGHVQGCKVELTGSDVSLLQRLFRRIE